MGPGKLVLLLWVLCLLAGCGESPPAEPDRAGEVKPVANVDGSDQPPRSPAESAVKAAKGLEGLLADLDDLEEPAREGVEPLPSAVRILRGYIDSGLQKAKVRTYSDTLNEARLAERYGPPDEVGMDSVKSTRVGGPTSIEPLRMLRYGWLRILVSTDGEIQYVKYLRD